MEPMTVGMIGLAVLIVVLFSRMPVGFVMGLLGVVGFAYVVSWDGGLRMLAKDFYGIFGSYSLTVVPLFMLMGQVTFHAGISSRLFDTTYKFIGHFSGGLAMATVVACALFAAICGSTNAAAATMATVALPEMKRYNYSMVLGTGTVAAGGSLGILIPPSVIFIIYGILTEQSIGKLFIAGVVPGILLTVLFGFAIYIWVKIKPEIAPQGPKTTLKEKIASLGGVLDTVILFVLVMGGLFLGFFTPTEAGAVGAGGAIILGFIRGRLSFKQMVEAAIESTRISCMVMVIVAGATMYGHFLAITRIPYAVATWVGGLPLPHAVIMAFIILIYLVGGMFIDALGLILLTIPIFYPVVTQMGYDPIWFGVIIVLVTQMGVITPPVGVNVYIVSGVARDVPLQTIFKGAVPFLIALILCSLILIPFPQIALYLPNLMR